MHELLLIIVQQQMLDQIGTLRGEVSGCIVNHEHEFFGYYFCCQIEICVNSRLGMAVIG